MYSVSILPVNDMKLRTTMLIGAKCFPAMLSPWLPWSHYHSRKQSQRIFLSDAPLKKSRLQIQRDCYFAQNKQHAHCFSSFFSLCAKFIALGCHVPLGRFCTLAISNQDLIVITKWDRGLTLKTYAITFLWSTLMRGTYYWERVICQSRAATSYVSKKTAARDKFLSERTKLEARRRQLK